MLNDLNELISIPSVRGEKEDGAPFGKEVRKALDWFLKKAESFGLRCGDLDGYCGFAEYGDPDSDCIGVLCHLDVVAAGDGWSFDPYKLTVKDGYLYGRGVVDDKGATVACLHALKKIKDAGLKLNKRIRIIAGCDEESGSDCLRYYNKHGEIPVMSFVPDADFPIINSEKGIVRIKLSILKDETLTANEISIFGGHTINVVPASGSISVPKTSTFFRYLSGISTPNDRIFDFTPIKNALSKAGLSKNDFKVTNEKDSLIIEALGVAGHAMAPNNADNALWKLFIFLNTLSDSFKSPVVETILNYFCRKDAAEALDIYKFDEESGELTLSMDIIKDNGKHLELSLDIRYPRTASKDEIKDTILSKMPDGTKIEILNHEPPLYISKDDPLVKTLLKVYSDCTGLDGHVLYCGGGTYARRLPNSIAFGPTFPGVQTNIHNIDERTSVENFEKLESIYKEAMTALAKL